MPEINEDLLTPKNVETISPFLEGTNIQYAWDSTSLGLIKTCPRLYQYTMIDGWQSKDESIHLRFGIEYHQAMQDYDISRAAGIKHDDAVHDIVREALIRTKDWKPDPLTKAGKYKNRESLIRAIIIYCDMYQDDPAKTYIKEDGTPAVELSFRFELDWGPDASFRVGQSDNMDVSHTPYLLCGHLDRVVTFQEELFVMDYKTTTTTPGSYYFDQFQPNNQMSLYSVAAGIVLDAPIKGVIINAIQLLLGKSEGEADVRPVRGFTQRTKNQTMEWLVDLRNWLALAESYATAAYWPMNDTACDKFGGCRFRSVCSLDPQIRERFMKSNFNQLPIEERWNPLRPR